MKTSYSTTQQLNWNSSNAFTCVGNFGTTHADYYIGSLDQFDKEYYSHDLLRLKEKEVIVRIQTEKMKMVGLQSICKINLATGRVYFNKPEATDADYLDFESRGLKIRYLNMELHGELDVIYNS